MKLTTDLGERSYDIILKRGSLARAGALGNLLRKVLVVCDDGVPAKMVDTVLAQCGEGHRFVLPAGEASKSVEHWQAVQARMQELGFGTADAVAAVGGGVALGVAGCAAATYQRGVDLYLFPTTTLAQADACVGGEAMLNLGSAKDVLGVLHQPRLVVVDPDTLNTLPPRPFAAGLAAMMKLGLVGTSEIFSILEVLEPGELDDEMERLLYLCLRYKKGVVERDEPGTGEGRLLAFGHTIGYGIETAALAAGGAAPLLHGECVALGMLPMLESRSLQRRVKAVMKKFGLPLTHPFKQEDVLEGIRQGRRREGDTFTVVRVKTTGRGYVETIDLEELCLLLEG